MEKVANGVLRCPAEVVDLFKCVAMVDRDVAIQF